MIVQIYEIQTPEEAETCIQLGVDHIGSVLLSKDAWKDPTLKSVFRVTSATAARNSLIPLFPDLDIICKAIDFYRPHYIHLCDTLTDRSGKMIDISPMYRTQSEIKKRFSDIQIIRSIPIPQKNVHPDFPTLRIAAEMEPVSDLFLTDTWMGKEPVEGYIGITGKTVDWETAKNLIRQSRIPVILAGGLGPENVYEALTITDAAGADSCTRTNMPDATGNPIRFKKDFNRVEMFVREVRRAEKIRKEGPKTFEAV